MLTRLRHGQAALVGISIAVLLAACSGSSTPQAGQTTPPAQQPTSSGGAAATPSKPAGGGTTNLGSVDPCSLLTQAEVDTAAGQPLGPGRPARLAALPGVLEVCQWSTSDFAGSVELHVGDWTAIKAQSTTFGLPMVAVPGVGDEALTFNQDGHAADLYVRKGTTGFMLSLGDGQYIGTLPDLGLAREKVLAAAVLGRL